MNRDPEIAAALAELDVPEHGPAFWDDLAQTLRTEPVPLAPRRGWRRHAVRVTTVAAAVAVLAVALGGGLGTEDGPLAPRAATAAEVAEKVNAALAAAESLRGVIVARDAEGPGARTTFVTTATGDLRLETTTPAGEVNVIAYDAQRGVEEGYWLPGPGGGFAAYGGVRTGLAPVQTPDQGPMDWVLRTSLSAALLAAHDGPAPEVTYDGRPAWRLEAAAQPQDSAGDAAYDRIVAVVDQESALPVQVTETRQGRLVREMTIEGLATGPAPERAAFDLDMPAAAKVSRTDGGFRRVAVADVEAAVGYRPLVPSSLPDGFELAEVAVAAQGGHTGAEGLNPPSAGVVSIAYRRGFGTVLVTTRRRTAGTWTDPMASGEGIADRPEPVALSGALSGARAELLVSPQGTAPHVWALTDTLVVTVSGDLTRDELLAVAGSLAA